MHGPVRIAFTPDEEVGEGTDPFDIERFGAVAAYTLDGSEVGEIEDETFNAHQAHASRSPAAARIRNREGEARERGQARRASSSRACLGTPSRRRRPRSAKASSTPATAFDDDDLRLVETLADQAGSALRSAFLYEQLERAYLGTAEALAAALEAKDSYTAHHARSIVEHAEAVGTRLGLGAAELRDLRFGAVFHDIGKIAVPEAILDKRGPLTPAERAEMERHTIVGEQILAPVDFLAGARKLVRHEHERWDGAGYPDGLAGEAIPIGARIILACDAYHAMTSDRPYRRAMSADAAREELRRHAGTQFDPAVVDALLAVLGAPPRP